MLRFEGIEKVLIERFPEVWERIQAQFGSYYDLPREIPEAYPIFEDVVQRHVSQLLEDGGSGALLRRYFEFFEDMACSTDSDVTDLLGIAIVENLVNDREKTRRAWNYMGPKTKEEARATAREYHWESNLPLGEAAPRN